jgi:hypothetical protein
MSFDKLLGELAELQAKDTETKEALVKSEAGGDAIGGDKDDEAIAAAAGDNANSEGEGEGGDKAGDEGGEGELGKSFKFTLENGEEIEAVDGTELVKSLIARCDTLEGVLADKEDTMVKALGGALDLIKSQGEQIAALRTQVGQLASAGRGRKTVLTVAEKPEATTPLQKSEPEGIDGKEFLVKALSAQAAGRITGHEVSVAETSLLKGLAVPAGIVKRVLG